MINFKLNSTSDLQKLWLISWLIKHNNQFLLCLPIILTPIWWLLNQWWLGAGLYLLGWYLGYGLMWLDRQKLYAYYFKFIQAQDAHYAKLITRNFLFVLALLPLSVFILTSSGSALGLGFVGAILLILAKEMWQYYQYPESFVKYFIQSEDKEWSHQEIKYLTYGLTVFTSLIIFLGML